MTDEEALRAAVLAHPDDDTPRLVYADWCDDAGDPDRAAFIRAQVDAARAEPWSPAARAAEVRANELLTAHVEAWTMHVGDAVEWCGFTRGFIEQVGVHATRFASGLDVACRSEPIREVQPIRGRVHVEDAPLDIVLECPHLARLTRLDLRHATLTSSYEFDQLAGCEKLAGLTDLSLASLRVPPEWLVRFLAGGALPALTALDVSDIPNLGPALANGLSAAPHRRFTKLNLSGVRLLSGEMQRVLSSRAVSEVEELRLGWPFATPGPLTMLDLGWVVPWSRLRLLDLAGQQLGQDGVAEILRWCEPDRLRWLGLTRNAIGAPEVQRLMEEPCPKLSFLDVSDNGLSPQLVAALRTRFFQADVVG